MAIQFKVEVELGLEYDLGPTLEESVQVNEDDVVCVDEQPRVTFTRVRGEFDARTVVTVEADNEQDAESIASDAVSASYEVEDFVSVRYCNAEVVEVIHERPLVFEDTTSRLYASDDGRLQQETFSSEEESIQFVRFDGGESIFASKSTAMIDAFIAGYDFARKNG